MSIYLYDDYRIALRERLILKKANLGTAVSFQHLAKACRLQKTYVSRVMNGKAHFQSDQLYLACRYLGLTCDEESFLFLLFEAARTVITQRRNEIQAVIYSTRKRQLTTESHLQAKVLYEGSQDMSLYYLNPTAQLVHIFLTVDTFRKDFALLCRQLKISHTKLADILAMLQQLGIVDLIGGRYQVIRDNIHLPKESPLYSAYRKLMRLKSLEGMENDKDAYAFSAIFSTTPKIRQAIMEEFLAYLKKVEHYVNTTEKAQGVYQINFDLVDWGA